MWLTKEGVVCKRGRPYPVFLNIDDEEQITVKLIVTNSTLRGSK